MSMIDDNFSSNRARISTLLLTVFVILLVFSVVINLAYDGESQNSTQNVNANGFEDLDSPYTISVSGIGGRDLGISGVSLSIYSEENTSYIKLTTGFKDLYWSTQGEIEKIRGLQKFFVSNSSDLPRHISNVHHSNNKTTIDSVNAEIKTEVKNDNITSISGEVSYKTSDSKPEWFKGQKSIKSYDYLSGSPGLTVEETEDHYELYITQSYGNNLHTLLYYNCKEIDYRSTEEESFIQGVAFKAPKNRKCPTRVIGISEKNKNIEISQESTLHLLAGFSN
jgi:hypothetical protein